MARARITPRIDPDCGDDALTSTCQDIVIGRWQGVRDLLWRTGNSWSVRGHRIRRLAQVCATSSTVESWLSAEPDNGDALVMRAATETVRIFNLAVAAGRDVPMDRNRVDSVVASCMDAAEARTEDPTPWTSLISVARLYPGGAPRALLARSWDELLLRDAYNVEGHLQVLHYYSSRWHGSHGLMYDFARDAAGVSPPGCPLPVLIQYARVEEYRYDHEAAQGKHSAVALGRHWNHDGPISEVRRTWQRWIAAREQGPIGPSEVRDVNYLVHAACYSGQNDIAAALFRMLGNRATPTPWSHTGDPEGQITKWAKKMMA